MRLSTSRYIFLFNSNILKDENKMNSQQAKRIQLVDLLAKLGFDPQQQKNGGREFWYCSPFRDEKTASFKVLTTNNVWYDHGEGEGGNVLDFALKYANLTSIKEALAWLSNYGDSLPFIPVPKHSRNTKQSSNKSENKHVLKSAKALHMPLLFDYAQSRGIDRILAREYLQQVHFYNTKNPEKTFFALGFENASGGFEYRNSYFGGTIGSKDVTHIRGNTNFEQVDVFEGFFDFLSFLVLAKQKTPKSNVIVLNSLSMTQRAINIIHQEHYSSIRLWLDNDPAGDKATNTFLEALSGVKDCRTRYAPKKDLNDFLKAKNAELDM